ncbi:MAG: patatin-like phospholipase family protein [Burkholderiaceae bacterium]|nr:patatin-like phospholipase family protein [Burkholderiales bacterium]MCZ8340560.1 patatin-like phospholipase family protein [Burkholderiaceae bacterium]
MKFLVPLRAPRAAVAWPLRLVVLVALWLGLAACGSLPRNATPAQSALEGTVPNFPDVRGWVGQTSSILEQDLVRSFAQESPQDFPTDASGTVRYAHLALSGGGANGAFGAGFLNGWTATGTRPVFKIVTGVSTGALMAPFAFIGPPYDEALRDFYTTVRSQDIFVLRSTFGLFWQLIAGEALADTLPLQAKIARHVDEPLLRRVAEAHQRGRRLYIGTANLDAPRFVIWNMGLIASSGRPEALELFRKVMLASASIPVAFPPVFFEVELRPGGPRYDEMHVDGGVGARVFLNGGVLRGSVIRERGGVGGRGREDIFVIHNGQLIPQPDPVQRSLAQIASRSIDALGRATALGDLIRIHDDALREDSSFRWVTIPPDMAMAGDEVFDPVQMQALYALGVRMATSGNAWFSQPPGQPQQAGHGPAPLRPAQAAAAGVCRAGINELESSRGDPGAVAPTAGSHCQP